MIQLRVDKARPKECDKTALLVRPAVKEIKEELQSR